LQAANYLYFLLNPTILYQYLTTMKTVYSSEKERLVAERQQIIVMRNKQYVRVQNDMTDLYVQNRTGESVRKRKRINKMAG
jgi:predicted metalloprotease